MILFTTHSVTECFKT